MIFDGQDIGIGFACAKVVGVSVEVWEKFNDFIANSYDGRVVEGGLFDVVQVLEFA